MLTLRFKHFRLALVVLALALAPLSAYAQRDPPAGHVARDLHGLHGRGLDPRRGAVLLPRARQGRRERRSELSLSR